MMKERKQSAIWVRGVCKSYGKSLVLDHLDMTAEKGIIYGLLGASGCGKTTLLSSIVGSRSYDEGQIRLLGMMPGQVPVKSIGYMPQDVALVPEFSVKGALQHYGWLFGLSNDEIEARYKFLNDLLDLPDKDRLIMNLSGGQQRRVSFAVALIHNPEILILDEPTVGLDPVLRQKIWDYLVELTENENKTIIITTHYIEEARQANKIGLMRKGKLLAEGTPESMMAKYNCNNIEDVFLLLSRKQQEGSVASHEDNLRIPLEMELEEISLVENSKADEQFEDKKTSTWTSVCNAIKFTNAGHARALMSKNYQKFMRNNGTLVFALTFPIIQITLYMLTVGGDPNTVHLGVVDPEIANFANCEEYAKNVTLGGLRSSDNDSCQYTGLSCKYVFGLREYLPDPIYYSTIEEAKTAVQKGKITGIVAFNSNYTERTGRVRENLRITDKDLDDAQINIYLDKSNYPVTAYVESRLLKRYDEFTQELEKECGYNERSASIPIRKMDAVYSSYDAKLVEYMTPGALLTISLFLAISISSISIVTERLEGSWDRTLVSGVTKTEVVIFHFITIAVINAVQNIILFVITFYVYKVDCQGSLFNVLFLLTFQGIVGTAIGLLISILSRTVSECNFISMGMLYPLLVMSGMNWPLAGMHPILRQISYIFVPTTLTVESLSNIMLRGWGLTNYKVGQGFVCCGAWVIIFNILNVLILKMEKR